MKRYSVLFFVHFLVLSLFAQIPDGYYDSTEGKMKEELKTALHHLIKKANVLNYGSGAGETWSGFAKTDVRPDGTVWDMYTTNRLSMNGGSKPGSMNIEHSFAKSWWGGQSIQPYKDLFHLYPSNSSANTARSNYPLGVVSKETWDGSSVNAIIKVGDCATCPAGTGKVWEPDDEYKGDFARTYMYMVTAYEDFANRWTGNSDKQLEHNTYPVFQQWAIDMFMEWTRMDPVSEKEINRNNEVYKIQGNRNPYIDFPDLAEYVWGRFTDKPFSPSGNIDYAYISSPKYGEVLDMGTVAYQHTQSATLLIKGVNLTDDLRLSITGTNADLFSTPDLVVAREDALAGKIITIYFNASEVGQKEAVLNVSGGEAKAVTATLRANSTDDFMALPATFLSYTGFTANWTVSADATGYSLDVYTMESTGEEEYELLLEGDFTSEIPNGWVKTGYASIEKNALRLASGKDQGSVTTPVINFNGKEPVVTVKAMQFGDDAGAGLKAVLDNKELAVWNTTGTMQEYTVKITSAPQSGKITFSAEAGKRVYLQEVKVESLGDEKVKTPVQGYPLVLGENVFSHQVTGLNNELVYYYAVTPQGNDEGTSNVIEVKLSEEGETSLPQEELEKIIWFTSSDVLHIINLPDNCSLRLMDISGKAVIFVDDTSFEARLNLPQRGAYILQVINKGKSEAIKILY